VDRQRPREVGDERDARLERADQQRLAPGIVVRHLAPELDDARPDLVGIEEDLADAAVQDYGQDAFRSR
jgi:hypothetical protein